MHVAKRSLKLQFTDEEMEAPKVQKAAKKAEKAHKKLEKAEARIPKKKIVQSQRVYDPKENQMVTRLVFHETEKKRPSKFSQAARAAPLNAISAISHQEMHENAGDSTSSSVTHEVISSAEGGIRTVDTAHRILKDRPYARVLKAERAADRANLKALYQQAEKQHGWGASPMARYQQRKAIRKAYMEAKAGKAGASTVKASEIAAKAVRNPQKTGSAVTQFVARHKKGFVIAGVIGMLLLFLSSAMSSCSVMMSTLTSSSALSTYPSADEDMLAAEAQYVQMEEELQSYLDTYESTHDYDEYHFDLDEIEHDPYVLISMLTAMMEGQWTVDEVSGLLQTIFDRQYTLTEDVQVETRYRTETRTGYTTVTDPETGTTSLEEYEYDVEVPYDYYICYVTLENFNLSHLPVYMMDEDHLSLYATYMATLGNRPDLFGDSPYVDRYYGDQDRYEIPAEALADEQFAAMIAEAEKYLGYPYVWGGSSPSTSFDCSGFVSWVINHCGVGWNIGRLGAEGLRQTCSYVSAANAKPGDLIFFQGTYDTSGASHVGIYVGNNMMIHCGDPIQYTSISSSYWQSHFYQFGRLPSP
jgi:cell wall-associated NlpC family hydrolase